jgi:hypothetical protein
MGAGQTVTRYNIRPGNERRSHALTGRARSMVVPGVETPG